MTNEELHQIEAILEIHPTAVQVELPYSEVCMHMRLAGKVRWVVPQGTMAQILNDDGSNFSFPVTRGEAGLPGLGVFYPDDQP